MDARAIDGWMIAMYIWLLASSVFAGTESGLGWVVWQVVEAGLHLDHTRQYAAWAEAVPSRR